jgi:hypothetical protein
VRARLCDRQGTVLRAPLTVTADVLGDDALLRGIALADAGGGELEVELSWLTCHRDDATCHLQRLVCVLPVALGAEGYGDVTL